MCLVIYHLNIVRIVDTFIRRFVRVLVAGDAWKEQDEEADRALVWRRGVFVRLCGGTSLDLWIAYSRRHGFGTLIWPMNEAVTARHKAPSIYIFILNAIYGPPQCTLIAKRRCVNCRFCNICFSRSKAISKWLTDVCAWVFNVLSSSQYIIILNKKRLYMLYI